MIAFNAHFDGKVIVPDDEVDLPLGQTFVVHVESPLTKGSASELKPGYSLEWLAQNAVDDDLPADLSAQHDHYLYGTPKRDTT